jgi:hypothetical protein
MRKQKEELKQNGKGRGGEWVSGEGLSRWSRLGAKKVE